MIGQHIQATHTDKFYNQTTQTIKILRQLPRQTLQLDKIDKQHSMTTQTNFTIRQHRQATHIDVEN